jgi:hypothetical protein
VFSRAAVSAADKYALARHSPFRSFQRGSPAAAATLSSTFAAHRAFQNRSQPTAGSSTHHTPNAMFQKPQCRAGKLQDLARLPCNRAAQHPLPQRPSEQSSVLAAHTQGQETNRVGGVAIWLCIAIFFWLACQFPILTTRTLYSPSQVESDVVSALKYVAVFSEAEAMDEQSPIAESFHVIRVET